MSLINHKGDIDPKYLQLAYGYLPKDRSSAVSFIGIYEDQGEGCKIAFASKSVPDVIYVYESLTDNPSLEDLVEQLKGKVSLGSWWNIIKRQESFKVMNFVNSNAFELLEIESWLIETYEDVWELSSDPHQVIPVLIPGMFMFSEAHLGSFSF